MSYSIYLAEVKNETDVFCKIGMSAQVPRRIAQLSYTNPEYTYTLLHEYDKYNKEDALRIEREICSFFKEYAVIGRETLNVAVEEILDEIRKYDHIPRETEKIPKVDNITAKTVAFKDEQLEWIQTQADTSNRNFGGMVRELCRQAQEKDEDDYNPSSGV